MASRDLTITTWRSVREPWGHRRTVSWQEFVGRWVAEPELARDKYSVAGFSCASFVGDRRTKTNVEQVSALVLDHDEGDLTLDAAVSLWPKTKAVVYTTWSHTLEAPRLRVVLPFPRSVTPSEYPSIWAWAAVRLTKEGHPVDQNAKDASRFWFLPSYRPGGIFEHREIKGRTLNIERILKMTPALAVMGVGASGQRNIIGPRANGANLDLSASGRDFARALELLRDGASDKVISAELRRRALGRKSNLEVYVGYTLDRAKAVHEASAPRATVRFAKLNRWPAQAGKPAMTRVKLELVTHDGELVTAGVVVPSVGYRSTADVWRACFPDIDPSMLAERSKESERLWRSIDWSRRSFLVASQGGEVRWIRAAT